MNTTASDFELAKRLFSQINGQEMQLPPIQKEASSIPNTELPWQIQKTPIAPATSKTWNRPDQDVFQEGELQKQCYQELSQLVASVAEAYGMPENQVMSLMTVTELSRVFPETKEELLRVSGFTESKFFICGDRVLEITYPYSIQKKMNMNMDIDVNYTAEMTVSQAPAGPLLPGIISNPFSVKLEKMKTLPTRTLIQPVPSTSGSSVNLGSFNVMEPTGSVSSIPPMSVTKSPSAEEQETFKYSLKRSHQNEYSVPFLNCFIDINSDPCEWKLVSLVPHVNNIFYSLRRNFFPHITNVPKYTACFSNNFDDLTNFRINSGTRNVELNRQTLIKCSRSDLFSVLFHVLIHCAVYETSFASGKHIDDHDINFNEIKQFLNEKLHLNIGTDHSFLRSSVKLGTSYQCQGKCAKGPFAGIIHKDPTDAPNKLFENAHSKICGGSFHQIFSAHRTINNNTEDIHIIHTRAKSLKAPQSSTQCHAQPTELIDITNEEGPRVVNLCRVIDLEDNEFVESRKKVRKIVQSFKNLPQTVFEVCPICGSSLEHYGGLGPHINLCFGLMFVLPPST